MSLETVRPNSTPVNTGTVTGAGGDADAALADDSDATYVTFDPGETIRVGFANPTIPAGAVVLKQLLRVRGAKTSTANPVIRIDAGGESTSPASVFWATPITWTTSIELVGLDPDDTELTLYQLSSSTSGAALRVYAVYLDVYYVTEPELTIDAPTGTVATNVLTPSWTPGEAAVEERPPMTSEQASTLLDSLKSGGVIPRLHRDDVPVLQDEADRRGLAIKLEAPAEAITGDCLRQAVAFAYGIPLEELPAASGTETPPAEFWEAWRGWASSRGLGIWSGRNTAPIRLRRWIAMVDRPIPDACHSVVMEGERMIYDPSNLYERIGPNDVRAALAFLPPDAAIPGPAWRLPRPLPDRLALP